MALWFKSLETEEKATGILLGRNGCVGIAVSNMHNALVQHTGSQEDHDWHGMARQKARWWRDEAGNLPLGWAALHSFSWEGQRWLCPSEQAERVDMVSKPWGR